MAVTATPIFLQSAKSAITAYTTASTTSTHVTGGTNTSKVLSLTAVSNSTSAHVFIVGLSTGGVSAPIIYVSIPASAGTDGTTPGVNLLNSTILPGLAVDANGQAYVNLPSTSVSMTITATATINTGKQVTFFSNYGDY